MGQLITSTMRYVASRYGAMEFEIRLVYWPEAQPAPCFTINTPSACLPATGQETGESFARRFERTTYATEEQAQTASLPIIARFQGTRSPHLPIV